MSCEYEKILVAIDGSKGGEVALKEAIEVAKRNGAHLDVLRVMDLNSLEYGGAGIALDGEQIYEIEHDSEDYCRFNRQELFAKTGRWLCCGIRNSFGQMRRAGCAYKRRRR